MYMKYGYIVSAIALSTEYFDLKSSLALFVLVSPISICDSILLAVLNITGFRTQNPKLINKIIRSIVHKIN